jgi:GGDEF domain-containing protein
MLMESLESMRTLKVSPDATMPGSMADLRQWIHDHLHLEHDDELALVNACEAVLERQRESAKESSRKAIRAMSNDLATKVASLQRQLSKDHTLTDIAAGFNGVLADLTEQSHRDPKTKLLQFPWFMDRLQWFLGFEQRLRWCAVGLVDIASFKFYNDTLGHLVGDQIIERVALILAEQIRSDDLLAGPSQSPRVGDLHARFGGDEFAFLIPDVLSFSEACRVAQRFKTVVERYNWASVNRALAERPVLVDIGMACLQLGPLGERQSRTGQLAAELVDRADHLMYSAKRAHAEVVRSMGFRVDAGKLVAIFDWEGAAGTERSAMPT